MDTTAPEHDPIERVTELLALVTGLDPAEAIAPLAEVAELLESLLDEGEET